MVREEQKFSLTDESYQTSSLESLEHSHQDDMYLPQELDRTGYVFRSCVLYLVGPCPRMARLG